MENLGTLRLRSDLSLGSSIGHAILWIILTIVTAGLALFVYPYYKFRFILGNTSVLDSQDKRVGRLSCDVDLPSIIGNIVIWIVLTIITLGIAYFFYANKVLTYCISHTKVVKD